MVNQTNPREMRGRRRAGQILVGATLVLLLAAIFIPSLVQILRRESQSTVKDLRYSRAMNVAEAAVDKAAWRLVNEESIWVQASSGIAVSGYNDDTVYTDLVGGEYKVKLSSGPKPGQVTMLVKARDSSGKEVRGVQAIFSTPVLTTPVQPSFYGFRGPGYQVHWAPILNSYGLEVSESMRNAHFPRKFSNGPIKTYANGATIFDPPTVFSVYDTVNPTDGIEYWANQKDTYQTLLPDFGYYKARAIASKVPVVTSANGAIRTWFGTPALAEASPPGSGLFLRSMQPGLFFDKKNSAVNPGYVFSDPSAVIYFEDESNGSTMEHAMVAFGPHVFLEVEAFIVNTDWFGEVEFGFMYRQGSGVVNATIPKDANLEYQHPTAQALWNGSGMKAVWQSPTRCCYPINNVTFHGILYANHGFRFSHFETPVIVGALVTPNSYNLSSGNSPDPVIYYDETVAAKFRANLKNIYRLSWKPVSVQW